MSEIEWKQGEEIWGVGGSPGTERWHTAGKTREEAVAEGRGYYPGESFWIVRGHVPKIRDHVSVDDVEEAIVDRLHDAGGEVVDGFRLSKVERASLRDALNAWADTVGVDFWISWGDPEEISPG